MYFSDCGIVLLRQQTRESDRVAAVYTREHGRINLRFPGAGKPQGKLKAMSEPLSLCDFRLYRRTHASLASAAGGKIITVFPNIRADLDRTLLALSFCELMFRLTPLSQPSEGKFDLLWGALQALDSGSATGGARAAFVLRLMRLAGYGLEKPVLGIEPEFWRRLHEEPFNSLSVSGTDELDDVGRAEHVADRFVLSQLGRPLNHMREFAKI